jgi:hypothetical protein
MRGLSGGPYQQAAHAQDSRLPRRGVPFHVEHCHVSGTQQPPYGLRLHGNFRTRLHTKPVQTESSVRDGTRESVQNGTLRLTLTPVPTERAVMDGTVLTDQTESHVRNGTRTLAPHEKSQAQAAAVGTQLCSPMGTICHGRIVPSVLARLGL